MKIDTEDPAVQMYAQFMALESLVVDMTAMLIGQYPGDKTALRNAMLLSPGASSDQIADASDPMHRLAQLAAQKRRALVAQVWAKVTTP